MSSRWLAKADSVSTMVLWIGSTIAALICVAWLAKNLTPDHIALQMVDNELTSLQRKMNTACQSTAYSRHHYPELNQGTLVIQGLQICIDSTPCQTLFYRSNSSDPDLRDGNILLNDSYYCNNIMKCKVLHYNSESPPVYGPDHIQINDATTCSDKNAPIQRCRLLTCEVNTSEYIFLESITSINITKTEDGIWNLKRE